jgi:hypothetical protein
METSRVVHKKPKIPAGSIMAPPVQTACPGGAMRASDTIPRAALLSPVFTSAAPPTPGLCRAHIPPPTGGYLRIMPRARKRHPGTLAHRGG